MFLKRISPLSIKKPAHKKIIIQHFCRECGELYCERKAKAYKYDQNRIKYNGYKCKGCAKTPADIAPIFKIKSKMLLSNDDTIIIEEPDPYDPIFDEPEE